MHQSLSEANVRLSWDPAGHRDCRDPSVAEEASMYPEVGLLGSVATLCSTY